MLDHTKDPEPYLEDNYLAIRINKRHRKNNLKCGATRLNIRHKLESEYKINTMELIKTIKEKDKIEDVLYNKVDLLNDFWCVFQKHLCLWVIDEKEEIFKFNKEELEELKDDLVKLVK